MEKSTEINLDWSDIDFIEWLISRLKYLHGYSTYGDIVNRLDHIKHSLEIYSKQYSDTDLDKIISQYFIDFCLSRDETTSIGYTESERNNLRNAIKRIIADVHSNNVPKDILLK